MIYIVENEVLTVSVNDFGAELFSVKRGGKEYLWQGDEKYWGGRAPNLFPYIARLYGGEYILDGKRYEMKIHGISPYSLFEAEKEGDKKLVFTLRSTPETKKQYPRDLVFRVIYEISENVLFVTYEVINNDEKTMYFGVGGHPGFNVPLEEGKKFEDYELVFNAASENGESENESKCRRVIFTKDCFVTGKKEAFPLKERGDESVLPLSHSLFDEDAIVLCDMKRSVTLRAKKGGKGDANGTDGIGGRYVTVSFPKMEYLGIWHMPHTDAKYVCIEPWSSLPSTDGEVTVLENKKDLISLAPNEIYRNTWSVEIG